MLKKSASRASWSLRMAAAGVSIMTPTSTEPVFVPSAVSSARASPSSSRAPRSSPGEAIIGNMTASLPWTEARSSARSWVLKSSRRSRQMRIARQPSAGFSSFPVSRQGARLSDPMSTVRTTTRLPPIRSRASR